MREIRIQTENQCLRGMLNDTLTAREFAKRLPLTFTCRRCGTEYCAATACEVFDPSDLQVGWKDGSILLWNGWFAIDLGGGEQSQECGMTMVVGYTDEYPELRTEKNTTKITITLAE